MVSQTDNGAARGTNGYRVYQFLTDSIDADQYHQETYVNKMKELTTYSLAAVSRGSGRNTRYSRTVTLPRAPPTWITLSTGFSNRAESTRWAGNSASSTLTSRNTNHVD
jgi:hypothetical protein